MTYASISEVWGGVSGSAQLSTPLEKKVHPVHQKQIERVNSKLGPEKTQQELYKCNYTTPGISEESCQQVSDENEMYNNEKKAIAQGMQRFLPQSPYPQNYTFLPQYPWSPQAKQGYLGYFPEASSMWYSNPYMYNPHVAKQIYDYQMQSQMYNQAHPQNPIGTTYMTQMGPYQLPPPMGAYNPMMYPPPMYLSSDKGYPDTPPARKKREDFGNQESDLETRQTRSSIKTSIIFFMFFLIALSVILCIFMVCMCYVKPVGISLNK